MAAVPPNAGLIVDDSGNLYGTTTKGGDRDYNGTVFRLDTIGGMFTLLFKFGGYAGSYPYAALVRDPGGNLYGTTVGAGAHSDGVVFELNLIMTTMMPGILTRVIALARRGVQWR
jgi:uncharacterized repeat protein (TIGR03803 family)